MIKSFLKHKNIKNLLIYSKNFLEVNVPLEIKNKPNRHYFFFIHKILKKKKQKKWIFRKKRRKKFFSIKRILLREFFPSKLIGKNRFIFISENFRQIFNLNKNINLPKNCFFLNFKFYKEIFIYSFFS